MIFWLTIFGMIIGVIAAIFAPRIGGLRLGIAIFSVVFLGLIFMIFAGSQ